ncbi:MAG: DMT family transporter [Jatrophihabitantaceae bacterium]
MSLLLAVTAGLGSALAYGAGTAGQHAVAYTGSQRADAGELRKLARDPRWLLASSADLVGIGLQLVALANGPVVLVQPLLVVSLPVAVVLRSTFGGPRASRPDLGHCLMLILGLALFFLLLGEPSRGRIIGAQTAAITAAATLIGGGLAIAAVRHLRPTPRAVVFGTVAGCWFGVVSVLVEAVSSVWQHGALGRPEGLVPLAAVLVLALGGYLLVQIGFQLGPLGASFPPNLIFDPVVAVALGAALLGERLPLGGVEVAGYLLCVLVVGWAAVRLAEPAGGGTAEPVTAEPVTVGPATAELVTAEPVTAEHTEAAPVAAGTGPSAAGTGGSVTMEVS